MKNFSSKQKIIALALLWVVLSFLMFKYFFNILDMQNQQILDSMGQDRQNLATLQSEDKSFKLAQGDLQQMAQQTYQPDNFFTHDISLVNEVSTLENLGQKYNVVMQLSGLSGTVESAAPAPTATAMVMVPYSMSINGTLTNVVNFISALENLGFMTTFGGISVSAAQDNEVNAGMAAAFYVRK